MTIGELIQMLPEESELWITAASESDLLRVLLDEIDREIADMDSGELREALYYAYADGSKGYNHWNWNELVKEVHDLVTEGRE
jgi:hypothetical protein